MKTVKKTIAMLGLLALPACAPSYGEGDTVNIHIVDEFIPEQTVELIAAVEAWDHALRGTLHFHLLPIGEAPDDADHLIRIEARTLAEIQDDMNTHTLAYTYHFTGETIYMPTDADVSMDNFRIAAMHELGHALGLAHAEFGVMTRGFDGRSDHPDCTDLRQFNALHGFGPLCF